jgi:hypothetical protein
VLVDVSVVSPVRDHLDNKETDRAADIKLDLKNSAFNQLHTRETHRVRLTCIGLEERVSIQASSILGVHEKV